MADKQEKSEGNVPGRYYVDRTCIAAKYCVAVAPKHFQLDPAGGHAVVVQQPENPDEVEAARDAMGGCPVGAIGDDGQEP